jgi:hypothetical protein
MAPGGKPVAFAENLPQLHELKGNINRRGFVIAENARKIVEQ